ncbi:MAG: 1-acyl-sn-glycerol-3-phosphate acyltransferase [Leptolyngbyaceae cyanobacterium bins.59]|nr:1-acyl-sn-glycerol-3-phosphate acyltransferase [Leptolyngbyaceae cyanobacterium bins.59]
MRSLEPLVSPVSPSRADLSYGAGQETVRQPVASATEAIEPVPTGKVESRLSPWLVPFMYFLGRLIVMPNYFGRVQVIGQENLPRSGPVILAPTHRSRWDAVIVPYVAGRHCSGRDLRFMVTADEVKGVQGWFIRRLGGFPVNTRRPSISSLRHGIELMLQGEAMVMFPEGGIFRQREVSALKPGLARLALQAESNKPDLGIQIVPISIYYSDLIPKWKTRVTVAIGKPIAVQAYCQEPLKESARCLTADLEKAIGQLVETYSYT